MARTALVLVDIQNDYFPGGRMELVGPDAAAAQAVRLLEQFRRQGLPVIHVRHESLRPNAAFFLPGTDGARLHESVAPPPARPWCSSTIPTASATRTCKPS